MSMVTYRPRRRTRRRYALARPRRAARRVYRSRPARYLGRRRSSGAKIPLLTSLGLLAGVMPSIASIQAGNWTNAGYLLVRNFTGYNPATQKFEMAGIKSGLLPLVVGATGSMVASKMGVNKRLKLPFIKL